MNKNIGSSQQLGFTLIEMMIVVAILAILSVIAFPTYTRYIERGDVLDARAELIKLQELIARDRIANPVDTANVAAIINNRVQNTTLNDNVAKKYTISVIGTTLAATPAANMSKYTYGVRVDRYGQALVCKDSAATKAASVDSSKCKERINDLN